jgi:hypothetical protein
MKLRFYRETTLWYADLPEYLNSGGSKEDCLMVAGADKLLDKLAILKDEIILDIDGMDELPSSIENICKKEKMIIYRLKLDGLRSGWGFYDMLFSFIYSTEAEIGLCPVSAFVFGHHPKYLIIRLPDDNQKE